MSIERLYGIIEELRSKCFINERGAFVPWDMKNDVGCQVIWATDDKGEKIIYNYNNK